MPADLANDLLVDAFGRIRETVHQTVEGLSAAQLAARVDPDANTIGWLVWHLTRVQDHHLAELAGRTQVWQSGDWAQRLGLDLGPQETGYGHSSAQVAAVRVSDPGQLVAYHDAVHDATVAFVRGLADEDYPRIVDRRWEPPVTMAVRLVSVISDDLQHAGQAAILRGVVERTGVTG